MPLSLPFNTQTMHTYKVNNTQQHCYAFLKILHPWRNSNPGLVFMCQFYDMYRSLEFLVTLVQLHSYILGYFFRKNVNEN
jgi:hypothetical protein